MLFVLVITKLLLQIFPGSIGLEIILLEPHWKTPCIDSLRTTDQYVLSATFGPGVDTLVSKGWDQSVSLQILEIGTPRFVDICQIEIGIDAIFCGTNENMSCSCDHVDNDGTASVSVISTAFITHNRGVIRGKWKHRNGTNFYSHNNVTLPRIFDITNATLELQVNGYPASVSKGSCGELFTPEQTNVVQLCCVEFAKPCFPKILFNDIVVADYNAQCVNYSFFIQNGSFTVNVTLAYAVCELSVSVTKESCMMKTYNAAAFSDFTSSLAITFGIIFTIVFIFFVLLLFAIKKKRSGDSSGDADMTETSNACT